jgi:HSP20 family protein
MTRIMFDPMRGLENFAKKMNDVADNFERGFVFETGVFSPRIDIVEMEESYIIYGEFPGMSKEDIKINVNEEKILKIKGNKIKNTDESKSFLRTERTYGEFERTFMLADNIDLEKISAKYENGVLELTIAKKEPVKPKEVDVQIA